MCYWKKLFRALFCAVALLAADAYAWGPLQGHVTYIVVDGFGGTTTASDGSWAIYFQMDVAAGNVSGCVAPTDYFIYSPPLFVLGNLQQVPEPQQTMQQLANQRAVLSTLQTAISLGTKIELFGITKSGVYCQVNAVRLLNN